MRYFVYLTENCIETSEKYGLRDLILKIKKKVETDQSVQFWEPFFSTPYIKKNLGKDFRLFAIKQPVDENCIVISFIACVSRGNNDYYNMIKNPELEFRRYVPSNQELVNFINTVSEPIIDKFLPLSEIENCYLYQSGNFTNDDDIMIFESPDWVKFIKSSDYAEEITRFYDILQNKFHEITETTFHLKDENKKSIYLKRFDKFNAVFLICPCLIDKDTNCDEILQKYKNIFKNPNITYEDLLRNSRKTYPSYILADETQWKIIQKDEVGNMALSPEETEILNTIFKKDTNKIFPLFIYGRPGSGKSTILQYLFADYMLFHLSRNKDEMLEYPPIFLTYSENLIEIAKKNVESILKCNSKYSNSEKILSSQENMKIFNSAFAVFQDFLFNHLPIPEQKLFPLNKRIEFPKFKLLYEKWHYQHPNTNIRELNAEIVWHAIRTYIKGMKCEQDAYFDYDSYCELPEEQQSIKRETFKIIYNDIWEKWYKLLCEKNGFWDTQDLVFKILNTPGINLSKYPAVFCDEAQDFSKIELDLILQISLFYKRTLPSNSLKFVPFAFAGDPFQTLNPTGFDWDAVKANFHEKIVLGMDKTYNAHVEINVQELSHNYRSNKDIVGLCNLIQLLRGILFNQKNIIPQKTWFDQDSKLPVYFNLRDPICEQNFREQEEIVVILPCQEGEEEDYVKNDDFLNTLVKNDYMMRNFLSPMRAKGLEFSRVVLYKFGSEASKKYPDLLFQLESNQSCSLDRDSSLPKRYFLNRLYVAASRAKNHLIIVDDDDGINTLWNNRLLQDFDRLIKLYKSGTSKEWSTEFLRYVVEGNQNSWTQDRDNPQDLARDFETAGILEKDSYKLQLAENNYLRANMPQKATECRAKRFEILERYDEAGDLYINLSLFDKALWCYWIAESYNKIINNSVFSNKIYYKAARYKLSSKTNEDINNFLTELITTIQNDHTKNICYDSKWSIFVNDIIKKVITVSSKFEYKKIYSKLKELESLGISINLKEQYAELAYHSCDYKYAVYLWDSLPKKFENDQKYQESKAYVEPFPLNLIWFEKLGYNDKIIKQWEDNKAKPIDLNYVKIIVSAMLKEKKYEDAIDLLAKYPDETHTLSVYKQTSSLNNKYLLWKVVFLSLKILIDNLKWYESIKFIDEELTDEDIKNKLKFYLIYRVATLSKEDISNQKEGPTEFFDIEFTGKYSIEKLCETLQKDNIEIKENSLSAINSLLESETLYQHITSLKNSKKPSDKIIRLYENYERYKSEDVLKLLNRLLLEEFYSDVTPKSRSILYLFIKENIVHLVEETKIPFDIAAAAVEKVCTFLDAIKIYEHFWKANKETDLSKKALKRWIACKIKYSEYLKTKKSDEIAGRHRYEALEMTEKYLQGISVDSIPPNLEIKYNDEELNKFIMGIEITKTPKETIEGITTLHEQKWDTQRIARAFNLDVILVENVLKYYKCIQ